MDVALPGLAQLSDAAHIFLGVKIVLRNQFFQGTEQLIVFLESYIYKFRHMLVVREEVFEAANKSDRFLVDSRLNPATHTVHFRLIAKQIVLYRIQNTEPRGGEPQ